MHTPVAIFPVTIVILATQKRGKGMLMKKYYQPVLLLCNGFICSRKFLPVVSVLYNFFVTWLSFFFKFLSEFLIHAQDDAYNLYRRIFVLFFYHLEQFLKKKVFYITAFKNKKFD